MNAVTWILVVFVLIELIWIYKLHTQVASLEADGDDCCDELRDALAAHVAWAKEFHEVIVKVVTKCCPNHTDPDWPPEGPPDYPE